MEHSYPAGKQEQMFTWDVIYEFSDYNQREKILHSVLVAAESIQVALSFAASIEPALMKQYNRKTVTITGVRRLQQIYVS